MTRQLAAFILTSGIAALANFISRAAFSLFLPYAAAIVAAFGIGLVTAFVLNRYFVFTDGDRGVRTQFLRFAIVNLFGLALTLGISLLLAQAVFPAIGWSWYPQAVAHAIGIAAPTITSYLGHKYFSFSKSSPGT